MKRTTVVLPDDVYEEVRRAAFDAHCSISEIVRQRVTVSPKSTGLPGAQAGRMPLDDVFGIINDGTLTQNLDDELYGI